MVAVDEAEIVSARSGKLECLPVHKGDVETGEEGLGARCDCAMADVDGIAVEASRGTADTA